MRVLTERLSAYTTFRLGGPAARFTVARTAAELTRAVAEADAAGEPVLVLGGGSNLLVADEGFPGLVVRAATAGISASEAGDGVTVTVAAGENWAALVDWAVAEKLAGIECLAGIPGLAGATPIQNVGAYGQEVASTITAVRVYDRSQAAERVLTPAECEFGYRDSVFKSVAGRYVVLEVTFALARDPMSLPVRYPELARKLAVSAGERAPLEEVRDAVLALRRSKGMVLDPADPDTASAGSFFTNPVISAERFAELERRAGTAVPSYPAGDGQVKLPAAWLIEHAGFEKGFRGPGGARISTKHTLALTNAGGATTADVIGLGRQIVAGVREAFGVDLTNEPTLIGVSLDNPRSGTASPAVWSGPARGRVGGC